MLLIVDINKEGELSKTCSCVCVCMHVFIFVDDSACVGTHVHVCA